MKELDKNKGLQKILGIEYGDWPSYGTRAYILHTIAKITDKGYLNDIWLLSTALLSRNNDIKEYLHIDDTDEFVFARELLGSDGDRQAFFVRMLIMDTIANVKNRNTLEDIYWFTISGYNKYLYGNGKTEPISGDCFIT